MKRYAPIIACFQKYAVFDGRSDRKEFWAFEIFVLLVGRVLSLFTLLSNTNDNPLVDYAALLIFIAAVITPQLAVGFRRMQDVGKPGYFIFIPIYSYVLAAKPGQPHANEYGEPLA